MSRINTEGNILNTVFSNSKFDQNQKNSNLTNAIKIYEKIPNSYNGFKSNVGLVVGKVQSGKTANIITLAGVALDNDCKFIVMMLSDTKNLLDQNYGRILKSFDGCEKVFVFKQSADGDFNSIDEDSLNRLYNRGIKIIVCSLKLYSHIDSIRDKIKHTEYTKDYFLIVDDEGDDISQNTAKDKFSMDDNGNVSENLRSRNNESIVNLKSTMDKCGYISLTATPEAPLFLQKFQDLAPNYCVTLEPGIGYTGLTTFHETDSKNLIRINDYDCLIKDSGLPDSLIEAVSFFFAGCIYRKKNSYNSEVHSMMIHPAKEIFKHENVSTKLKLRLKLIEKSVRREEESGFDFFEMIKKNYNEISENENITYDDLLYVFNNYKVVNINGKATEKDINNLAKIFPYNILIGGDLLDRGITIPNLAVSYIIRDSKVGQVDTLLQRARWFGYKKDYIETCRVYMPNSLAEKYNEIIETEDSLWEFLEECSSMNYELQNCDFFIDIDSSILNPTSSSKASFEFGYTNVSPVKQQKNFTINSEQNNANILLVQNLNWSNSHILEYNNFQRHRYIDLSYNDFIEFINKFNFSDYNITKDSLSKDYVIKYVTDNINKYGNSISIVDMRFEHNEYRSVYDENCVRNLLQGRSEGKSKEDNDFYPGDRNLPEMKNMISLQIHHVLIKKEDSEYYNYGDEVIMLVLCLPKDFIIKNIVKRKNITDLNRIY